MRLAKMRYFVRRLEEWYSDSGRKYPWRKSTEPLFRVLVSEILLQRTRADAVAQVYGRFFERFPTWTDLSVARLAEIEEQLKPHGVAVILKAAHFCMRCRGVNKQNSNMVTSVIRGVFRNDSNARVELMHLLEN